MYDTLQYNVSIVKAICASSAHHPPTLLLHTSQERKPQSPRQTSAKHCAYCVKNANQPTSLPASWPACNKRERTPRLFGMLRTEERAWRSDSTELGGVALLQTYALYAWRTRGWGWADD